MTPEIVAEVPEKMSLAGGKCFLVKQIIELVAATRDQIKIVHPPLTHEEGGNELVNPFKLEFSFPGMVYTVSATNSRGESCPMEIKYQDGLIIPHIIVSGSESVEIHIAGGGDRTLALATFEAVNDTSSGNDGGNPTHTVPIIHGPTPGKVSFKLSEPQENGLHTVFGFVIADAPDFKAHWATTPNYTHSNGHGPTSFYPDPDTILPFMFQFGTSDPGSDYI